MCQTLHSTILLISSQYKLVKLFCYSTMRIIFYSAAILLFSGLTAMAVEEEWVLSGTFVSDHHSHAMFVGADEQEILIPLGNEFQGCEVVHITNSSVKIQCLDQIHDIDLRMSVGDVTLQTQDFNSQFQKKMITLAKQDVTEYMAQRQKVVSEIAFLPVMHEQKLKGYEISKIRPNTFASLLGLYNGDIVTSINGVSATDVVEFFQVLDNVAHASEVSIQVDRYGRSHDLVYYIQ